MGRLDDCFHDSDGEYRSLRLAEIGLQGRVETYNSIDWNSIGSRHNGYFPQWSLFPLFLFYILLGVTHWVIVVYTGRSSLREFFLSVGRE